MHYLLGELFLLSLASLWGAGGSRCALEIENLHAVSHGAASFPLYSDVELATYLNAVLTRAGLPAGVAGRATVLPVYSPDPLSFRRENRIFISTALLLDLTTEEELLRVLQMRLPQRKKSHRAPPSPPSFACSLSGPDQRSFDEVRATLATQLTRYEEWSRPRLKTRSTGP